MILLNKTWRDIKENIAAYFAVTVVIIIGIMLYVSMMITYENLLKSQEKYYFKNNFADVFADCVKAPQNISRAASIETGIADAEGRIVRDVFLEKDNDNETTTLRIISFSANQKLNKFQLETGTIPVEGRNEILVTSVFLKGNNFHIGDKIPVIVEGRKEYLRITGTARSPEYIYEIPDAQTITPNPKSFGVAYIPYKTAEKIFFMEGQVNNIVFTLEDSAKFSNVKTKLTRLLDRYGLKQLYERKDQLSHAILNQELTGLKASATTMPFIFLFVSASILYIMLKRMVESQRGQIGILKALGYSESTIFTHYLSYAGIIGFFGGIGGGLAGSAFSYTLAQLYRQYYNIPDLTGGFSLTYIFLAMAGALIFSLFAGWQGAKKVLSLSPVEAMRPPAPFFGKKILIEKIPVFWHALNSRAKLALRNIARSKQRSILAVLGVAAAFSLMVASGASFDAADIIIRFQFDTVEKYDLKVRLNSLVDGKEATLAGKNISGVVLAEPLLEIPVVLNNKWYQKETVLTGITKDSHLFMLSGTSGEKVTLPKHGLIISEQLAKILHVKQGDKINVKMLLGKKPETTLPVIEVIPQYVGLGAYADIHALSEVFNEQLLASTLLLKVETDKTDAVRAKLKKAKNISGIYDKTKFKEQFAEIMASARATQFVLLIFAFLTGFAIIYNVILISMSERERELATLIILGMTEREVSRILLYEQIILCVIGFIAGIPLSYAMLSGIAASSSNEIYNMPVYVSLKSFVTGAVGLFFMVLAAQWRVNTKVGKLPILDVLKEQG